MQTDWPLAAKRIKLSFAVSVCSDGLGGSFAMVARVYTVAFEGVDARTVDVQVQISSGLPAFSIVGLPDKAVAESRERVRGALSAIGLALPARRITVNLAPADLPKEGSHFDLPIALALLAAMQIVPPDAVIGYTALGELSLDANIVFVPGVLAAAIAATAEERGLICPQACGAEAAFAGNQDILAAPDLLCLVNHFKGSQLLTAPQPNMVTSERGGPSSAVDLADVKGQETAKRALEIAAAGGHNLLMSGPPGAGKSMLAACLPDLLPPLSAREALEVSMIASVAGALREGQITRRRPYRDPHHSASMAAMVGGGVRAKPGEVSLAHRGVLFLDELPEFSRQVLDSLRQPLESGETVIARANAHIRYPSQVQLIAAMNPCRCGYLADPGRACSRAPRCGRDYQSRISGPLFDRIDLHIEVNAVSAADLQNAAMGETSAEVGARVATARALQAARYDNLGVGPESRPDNPVTVNAQADGAVLQTVATPDQEGKTLLLRATEELGLSARAYHRVLRVARTLADLENCDRIGRIHIAEALSYRQT